MKKIILVAAMAVAAVGANAQGWGKGDWFAGAKSTVEQPDKFGLSIGIGVKF